MRSIGIQLLCALLLLACTVSDDEPEPYSTAGAGAGAGAGGQGASGGSAGKAGSAGTAGAGSGGAGSGGVAGTDQLFPPGCSASPPPLTPPSLPAGTVGEAYDQKLMIVGATASEVSWLVTGPLPDGLTLDPSSEPSPPGAPSASAHLHGTPSKAGTFSFEVKVSLKMQPACGAPPAMGNYALVIGASADADAGT